MEWAKTVWNWLVRGVDWVWRLYVAHANPKHVIAVFLVFNLAVAVVSFFCMQTWIDFYAVSGYWITLTGLLVAIGELYRARTVTDQIRAALNEEVRRQCANHYRFCLELAKSSLLEARTLAEGLQWPLAMMRLNDLVSHLSSVNSIARTADDRWMVFQKSVHVWVERFRAGTNRKRLAYNTGEWQELGREILNHLNNELTPFQLGEEVEDDT